MEATGMVLRQEVAKSSKVVDIELRKKTIQMEVIKEPLPVDFVQKIDTSVTAAKQSRAAGSRGAISEGQDRLETKDRQDRLETGDRRTERQDLLHDA